MRTYYSRKLTDEKTRLQYQTWNYMMKNRSRGPKNLFNLDDLSNYRSSNYMSSTVSLSTQPECGKKN